MSYIDGFVTPVPAANQQDYLRHAQRASQAFLDLGATRVVEGWADDVTGGEHTDFLQAVKAKEDEKVVFGWVEWPNKSVRDSAMERMMEDPRLNPETNPMPFDGRRMIYGGFSQLLHLEK